jgi:hypothetical protein
MSIPYSSGYTKDHLPVFLDGRIIGYLPVSMADVFETKLRVLKTDPSMYVYC